MEQSWISLIWDVLVETKWISIVATFLCVFLATQYFHKQPDDKGKDDQNESKYDNDNDDDDMWLQVQPLGLVPAEEPKDPTRQEKILPILADSAHVRTKLAEWLPLSLRFTKLKLIYSTNHHGRSLNQFYKHAERAKHTITLMEPLNHQDNLIVGMYASQAWRVSTRVYGDGNCRLFRIFAASEEKGANTKTSNKDEPMEQQDGRPSPMSTQCWKWNPYYALGSSNDNNNKTALLEQFQVGTRDFISMGGNKDGSAGLRLNEDLCRAESSPADGFENLPLAGTVDFEVGLVEVYQMVRQIDGIGVQ